MPSENIGFIVGVLVYVLVCAAICWSIARKAQLGKVMVVVSTILGSALQIFGVLIVLLIWALLRARKPSFQPKPQPWNAYGTIARPSKTEGRPTVASTPQPFCSRCGKPAQAEDKFCGSCGHAHDAVSLDGRAGSKITVASQVVSAQTTVTKDTVQCPKCGGTSITAGQKRFSGTKAVAGMLFVPGGILWGLHGKNKVIVSCLRCGHQWTPRR